MNRITDDSQLRTLIRNFRRARGLTQADVAKVLRVTVSRVSVMEREPEKLSVSNLLALLRVLGAQLAIGLADTNDGSRVRETAALEW